VPCLADRKRAVASAFVIAAAVLMCVRVSVAAPTPAPSGATPKVHSATHAAKGARGEPRQGPRNASDVSAQLRSDKSTYHVGEPVAVQISLVSKASAPILFDVGELYRIVRLVVIGSDGHPIAQNNGVRFTGSGSTHWATIRPGQTLMLARGAYIPLIDLGYRLVTPGTYTIEAIPLIAGDNITPDRTLRSNSVQVVLTQ